MRKIILLIALALLASGCSQIKEPAKTTQTPKLGEPVDKLVFEAKVEVITSGPPHIVSSKTVLDFGKLPYNMVERKEVLITNNRDFTVIAIPSANGSISKWLSFDKEQIIIEPKGKNTSLVSIRVTSDAEPGNYSGYVAYTFFKKP